MGTNNSHAVEVGQVFTPLAWAKWLIYRWGIFDAWIDRAAVCGNGKCNWAQPGKIKQILALGKPACDQPQLPLLQ